MMREAVSLAEQLWPYCRRPARSEATLAPCFSNIARGRTYHPAGELHATFDLKLPFTLQAAWMLKRIKCQKKNHTRDG
jgi:hypothetical protein